MYKQYFFCGAVKFFQSRLSENIFLDHCYNTPCFSLWPFPSVPIPVPPCSPTPSLSGSILCMHQCQQQHVLVPQDHQWHTQLPVLWICYRFPGVFWPQHWPTPGIMLAETWNGRYINNSTMRTIKMIPQQQDSWCIPVCTKFPLFVRGFFFPSISKALADIWSFLFL